VKLNYRSIQYDYNPQAISVQPRLLMSECRQKVRNREKSMLKRAVSEVGIGA
jgi:hypothetical protein